MLKIQETYVNETEGHIFGDSGWYEPFTTDRGTLFRHFQKEFGRCISKMYQDVRVINPEPQPECEQSPRGLLWQVITTGWVFQSRQRYDCARPSWSRDEASYIREVWVQLREDSENKEQETAS